MYVCTCTLDVVHGILVVKFYQLLCASRIHEMSEDETMEGAKAEGTTDDLMGVSQERGGVSRGAISRCPQLVSDARPL